MLSEKEKLDEITDLGVELNRVNDLDILMERILLKARHFVNADAGSIYILDSGKLQFRYSQNDTLGKKLQQGEKLIYSTYTLPIDKKSIAGYVATTGEILNIPDVYSIGPEQPYKFSCMFDEVSNYTTHSVLTVPLNDYDGDLLGVLQIINAQNGNEKIVSFSVDDEKIMYHFASIATVALKRAKMTRAILLRMIQMSELRDPFETGNHVNRVAAYSIELYEGWAQNRKIDSKEIELEKDRLRIAAMLHDVGKVGISDLILKKPGKLTSEEFDIMKTHTVHGAKLFLEKQSDFDEAAAIVALNHHERWDGHGYPGHIDINTGKPLEGFKKADGSAVGKKGEGIHIFGRIVALADVYDALSSRRVYKRAWDESRVLDIIREESGKQFDPEIVDVFFSRLNNFRAIRRKYKSMESS